MPRCQLPYRSAKCQVPSSTCQVPSAKCQVPSCATCHVSMQTTNCQVRVPSDSLHRRRGLCPPSPSAGWSAPSENSELFLRLLWMKLGAPKYFGRLKLSYQVSGLCYVRITRFLRLAPGGKAFAPFGMQDSFGQAWMTLDHA